MEPWSVQDAKARFSEFLDAGQTEGSLLKELLLSDAVRTELLVPHCGSARKRQVVPFHALRMQGKNDEQTDPAPRE